jgi:hypothetical protein
MLVTRRTLFATLFTMGLCGAAMAGTPSTGLGQAWPNAQDQSLSPSFHAYVFSIAGIRYIQINDTAGNVLGSVGTSGGQFIVLPIGRFAQLVSTPQQAAATTSSATPTASPTQVYNDGSTVIVATPMSDGTTQLKAATASMCSDPTVCGGQGAA